jgi:ATP-dependent Zn protease
MASAYHPSGSATGFTGADIQNLMNEAAILTARRGRSEIVSEDIDDALEKLIVGPEKKGALISERKRRLVAYHEVHARTHEGSSQRLLALSIPFPIRVSAREFRV